MKTRQTLGMALLYGTLLLCKPHLLGGWCVGLPPQVGCSWPLHGTVIHTGMVDPRRKVG